MARTDEYDGTPVTEVSSGGRSLGRDAITVGHVDEPVRFYRTSHPTIFAGFQSMWIDGNDDDGMTFDLACGAGFGSKYATLCVKVPGFEPVYEYVDITEVLQARVEKIVTEVTASPVPTTTGE